MKMLLKARAGRVSKALQKKPRQGKTIKLKANVKVNQLLSK
jgi:hypothetical protein